MENSRDSKGTLWKPIFNLSVLRTPIRYNQHYQAVKAPVQLVPACAGSTVSYTPGTSGIKARHPASCTTSLSYEICQRTLSLSAKPYRGTTRFRKSECKGTLFIRTGKTFHDIFSKKIDFSKMTTKRGGGKSPYTLLYYIKVMGSFSRIKPL